MNVEWPTKSCSFLRLAIDGLSNVTRLLPDVSKRFIERFTRVMTSSTVALSSRGVPVDTIERRLAFISVDWSRAIAIPQFGDDESYILSTQLDMSAAVSVKIVANSTTGVVRALATLLQMVADRRKCLPVGIFIQDKPKFKWRGLMVDTARRFQSIPALKRVCDGLEFARMNVLHLHLTDDQGWRFESRLWPRLTKVGNYDGKFYTQTQLSELVRYCAIRGVRVVPEINTPGHCAAALFAYPSLAPDHFPSTFVTTWGVHNFVLDPSSTSIVTQFVNDILREVSLVFSDAFIHVGGDEVVWPTPTNRQKAWMVSNNLTSVSMLHGFFQKNITFPALARVGRRAMGWNEMYEAAGSRVANLPSGMAMQWWWSWALAPSPSPLVSVMSTGFYLNKLPRAKDLYAAAFLMPYDDGAEACLLERARGRKSRSTRFSKLVGFCRGPVARS